jgi:hypothetical protein
LQGLPELLSVLRLSLVACSEQAYREWLARQEP